MATVNVVRLNDSDIERLAAALDERTGSQMAEIATRLSAIEALLPEKKDGKKKAAETKRGDDR